MHGLLVYEVLGEPMFFGGSATLPAAFNFDSFHERLASVAAAVPHLDERTRAGADLLARAAFESSIATKQVVAATAGEVLAQPAERTGNARALVEHMLVEVRDALAEVPAGDEEQRRQLQSLQTTLKFAREKSISSRFKDLADELLEPADRTSGRVILRDAYDARSQFVHDGKVATGLHDLTTALTATLGQVVAVRAEAAGRESAGPDAARD